MAGLIHRRDSSQLKVLAVEASQALARLDADRLEDLALCCHAIRHELRDADREPLAIAAREAATDMAIFARILDATSGNIKVMRRLLELRTGQIEYGPGN